MSRTTGRVAQEESQGELSGGRRAEVLWPQLGSIFLVWFQGSRFSCLGFGLGFGVVEVFWFLGFLVFEFSGFSVFWGSLEGGRFSPRGADVVAKEKDALKEYYFQRRLEKLFFLKCHKKS